MSSDSANQIDHEVRNSIVKIRYQVNRLTQVVKDIETELKDLDKRLERIEDAVTTIQYP